MLTRQLETSFDYKGISIKLDIPFNNVLLAYELIEDDDFTDAEKVSLLFSLLTIRKRKYNRLTDYQKNDIVTTIFNEYINVVKSNKKKDIQKHFDFKYDASYVYSSFMQEYNIDLYDQYNKLDWRKFIWLFYGLGDNTKIRQVIKIRSMKVPKRTSHNSDHIKEVMEAKNAYMLPLSDEERELQFVNSLKKFASQF